MKKLIVFSSLVIAFVFFYGCDRDNVIDYGFKPNLVKHENFFDSVYVLGDLHSEYLDSMYNRISRIKDTTDNFPDVIFETYHKQQATLFYEGKGYDPTEYIDTSDLYIDINETLTDVLDDDTTLSTPAKDLLEALDDAIDVYEDTDNLNAFKNTCDSIITEAETLQDSVEQVIVAIGASIGKASADYWSSTRVNDFEELASDESNIIIIKHNYDRMALSEKEKRILSSDIGGAVKGAIVGAKAGAVGGIATAVAGAIAGGLIRGSVASLSTALLGELGVEIPWWLSIYLE